VGNTRVETFDSEIPAIGDPNHASLDDLCHFAHRSAFGPLVATAPRAFCARMRISRSFSTRNKDLRRLFASKRNSPIFATSIAGTTYENPRLFRNRTARKKKRTTEFRQSE
jgi:hypothetical protein